MKKGGRSNKQAEKELAGTFSEGKNELLFSEFGINYSKEPEIYRRGTIVIRELVEDENKMKKYLEFKEKEPEKKLSEPKKIRAIKMVHDDMIKGTFWKDYFPEIFAKI